MDSHHDGMAATKRLGLDEIYACGGDRAYLVGAQNGTFPDMGHHVENEMGGLWAHPVKLLDGFWLGIEEPTGNPHWLVDADEFTTRPVGVEHRHRLTEQALDVRQQTFIPDGVPGLVIRYEFRTTGKQDGPRDLRLRFLARSDLRPTWLADERGVHDAPDSGTVYDEHVLVTDDDNPWSVAVGANQTPRDGRVDSNLWGPEETSGPGVTSDLSYELSVPEDEAATLVVAVAGGLSAEAAPVERLRELLDEWPQRYEKKVERYDDIAGRTALDSPDDRFDEIYEWVKLNLDMLWRDVDGVASGFGAGLPTYPWWFGTDTAYTVQGALPLGYHEESKASLETIARFSEQYGDTPRIIHEASTNGVIFHEGNVQETPHFVRAVYDTYRWTGDESFVREHYPLCRRAMSYLFEECDDDGDLLPEGYGIMEVKGLDLELIDSAVYACDALDALAGLASVVDDEATREWASSTGAELAERIEEWFWNDEAGRYDDLVGTPAELLDRFDDIRWQLDEADNDQGSKLVDRLDAEARRATDPDEERSWPFYQWVIATPMEVGITSSNRAHAALDHMETTEFTSPWGLRLSGTEYGNEHTMTISTGVMAAAEVEYGRADAALEYLRRMARTESYEMPGSLSEMSPDYGCCMQAWTAYGFGYVVVEGFAGIQPDAGKQHLTLAPTLPSEWDQLSLSCLRVGDVTFDYRCIVEDDGIHITLDGGLSGWTVAVPDSHDLIEFDTDGENSVDDGQPKLTTGTNHLLLRER
ncbi:hypothetical protein [Haladaptatus sp. NG-SE-30]